MVDVQILCGDGHNAPVAGLEIANQRAHFHDLAHGFMPKDEISSVTQGRLPFRMNARRTGSHRQGRNQRVQRASPGGVFINTANGVQPKHR